jgi:uncharacterized protein YkwD
LAALALVAWAGPVLAVIGTPETQVCDKPCEACIESEMMPGGGSRCVKCGIDPKCLGNPGDPGLTSDFTDMVKSHNQYRGTQCAGSLSWSQSIANGAQEWANKCTKAHSPGAFSGGYGENLAWGGILSGTGAVDLWYNEIKDYNFNKPVWSTKVGHFTQVVWKGSNQIGCGVARCGNENYWVCRYAPPGNFNVSTQYVSAEQAEQNLKANVGCAKPAAAGGGGGNNETGGGGGATVEVNKDVDVYAAPGGSGQPIGVLRHGKKVNVLSCADNWCNVSGKAVPTGKGWVYDGPDYDSLKN